MTIQNHSINYVEFSTTDMAATQRFYREVLGWDFVDYGPTYASFTGAGLDGGFSLVEEADFVPAGQPLIVLYATDLEATEAAIRAHTKISTETFSFPGGRRFHFKDPSGNELAVWSE